METTEQTWHFYNSISGHKALKPFGLMSITITQAHLQQKMVQTMQHFLTADVILIVHNVVKVPTKYNFLRSTSPFIGREAAQRVHREWDRHDISRRTKGYKQQSFIIFHSFHTWALVASLPTPLVLCLQLNATQTTSLKHWFPEQKFWRQIWNSIDIQTDSHTQNKKTWPFYLQQSQCSCTNEYQLY